MVDEINELLLRLRKEFENQRQFLGDVAHTLRTRLAGVKLHAELGARVLGSNDAQHFLKRITQGINGLTRLLLQSLVMARTEQQARDTEALISLDLVKLAREVTLDFEGRAKDRNITLEFVQNLNDCRVIGNAARLRIMLENLIDNGLQYNRAGGHVWVSLGRSDQGIYLEVKDSGLGVPSGEKERIFSPFYRAPGSPGEGSGLGLSIVKRVVDQHGAKLELFSEGQGQGTSVKIFFPESSQKLKAA